MSHFTHIKTDFQNLFYLKKALNRLSITYETKLNQNSTNLIISKSNEDDIEFSWNGQQYELIADLSFWEQTNSIQNFLDRITQQYAGEVIIGESQKIGFQPVKYQQNSDGSNTLVLERWNTNK